MYLSCNSFDSMEDIRILFSPEDAAKWAFRLLFRLLLTVVLNFMVSEEEGGRLDIGWEASDASIPGSKD